MLRVAAPDTSLENIAHLSASFSTYRWRENFLMCLESWAVTFTVSIHPPHLYYYIVHLLT